MAWSLHTDKQISQQINREFSERYNTPSNNHLL